MSEDYRGMWKDLGLDLAGHDALLGVLSGAYRDIFLSQKIVQREWAILIL